MDVSEWIFVNFPSIWSFTDFAKFLQTLVKEDSLVENSVLLENFIKWSVKIESDQHILANSYNNEACQFERVEKSRETLWDA